jgi:hypothetical protein
MNADLEHAASVGSGWSCAVAHNSFRFSSKHPLRKQCLCQTFLRAVQLEYQLDIPDIYSTEHVLGAAEMEAWIPQPVLEILYKSQLTRLNV